jgi:hypothetical protein
MSNRGDEFQFNLLGNRSGEMMVNKITFLFLLISASAIGPHHLLGDLFHDDFSTGASPLWENNSGNWIASGGVYAASTPDNFPNAHSALPFNLADFVVELDINDIADGGVWLRSAASSGSIGRTGVLLVTGVNSGLYWHNVTSSSSYGATLNAVTGLFSPGDDPRLRIEVSGDDYRVFVDGSSTAATSITSTDFTSGKIALYDNSSQTFDNVSVSVVPEPTSAIVAFLTIGLVTVRRQRK